MKTFKLNTQILIICCALIATGAFALETRIGLDGREYLIEYDKKYNWFQALHECARRNSQLLTIDSADKQNVINMLLDGEEMDHNLWLGANDDINPNGHTYRPFFWSATGKQFTYTNWEESYPYDLYGDEHCVSVLLTNKKWENWDCTIEFGFICEEKQSLESSNKNSNNASDGMVKFTNHFDLKFLSLLKDNMAQLNGQLENIKQLSNDTKYEVEKLTNITQNAVEKILDKQEISSMELNHEITKQGNDLSDQLKRSVDELNAKFSDKQNFTSPLNNFVFINPIMWQHQPDIRSNCDKKKKEEKIVNKTK